MNEEENIQEPSQDDQHLPEPGPAGADTTNLQAENKDMEIHHHPHAHHKKRWADYLFEFLLLFLAVTAGFLVENWREHYIEHRRSKQYAAFLHRDLLRDTANLTERTAFMMRGTKKLDSLILLLKSFKESDSSIARIYDLSAYAYSGAFFSATTSTMEQLKNSGSVRYFASNELIDCFSQYDTDLQRLKSIEDRNAYLNEEIRIFLSQFLDLNSISVFTINTATDSMGFTLSKPSISGSLKLYKKDPEHLIQYANLCSLRQLDWNTRMAVQARVLRSARNLIASLQKEYHLVK